MAGRPTRVTTNGSGKPFRMSPEHRNKIAKSQILSKLIQAAEGSYEMTSTQAMIGIALMKKVLPDLSHNQNDNTHDLSDPLKKLAAEIAARGTRVGEN